MASRSLQCFFFRAAIALLCGFSSGGGGGSRSSSCSLAFQPPSANNARRRFARSGGLVTQVYSSSTANQQQQPPAAAAAKLVSGNISWNSLVGQADRAFRLGIQLEKNGQARKASAAFHEAATLYQCFLDSRDNFGHVTSLPVHEVATILAYACLRLGFLSLDALGDSQAAVRLYTEAALADPQPSAVSFRGVGLSCEAAGRGLEAAIEAYRTALKLQPDNRQTWFHLAVALDRLGATDEADEWLEKLRREEAAYACLVDSWGYVRWHTRHVPNVNLYRGTRDMMQVALTAAMPLIVDEGGIVAEFGVGSGRSLRMTQELLPLSIPIHGFDTFTGLPQAWGNEPAGAYSTGGIVPNLSGNVYFYKGLFRDTLGPFLQQAENENAILAYANVDCDLYSSTLDILEAFHGRIVPGTVLLFDEYLGHVTWRQDEFRAWRECCNRFGWKYEYLAFSLSTKQAVVRVLEA